MQHWLTGIQAPRPIDDTGPKYRTAFTYNRAGWIETRSDQTKSRTGSDLDPLFTYTYDEQGHQVRWASRNANVSDKGREVRFSYWPNGLLRERMAVKKSGPGESDIDSSRKYQYAYNPNRSLVRIVDLDANSGRAGLQSRTTDITRDTAERELTIDQNWSSGNDNLRDTNLVWDTDTGDLEERDSDITFNSSSGGFNRSANTNRIAKFEYDSMGRETKMSVGTSTVGGSTRTTTTRWHDGSLI